MTLSIRWGQWSLPHSLFEIIMLGNEHTAWHVIDTKLMAESRFWAQIIWVQVSTTRHFLAVSPYATDFVLLRLSYFYVWNVDSGSMGFWGLSCVTPRGLLHPGYQAWKLCEGRDLPCLGRSWVPRSLNDWMNKGVKMLSWNNTVVSEWNPNP